MKRLTFFFFYFFVVVIAIGAQNKQSSNLDEIDFLSYKYKYLDSEYRIKIKSGVFNKAVKKYHFYPSKLKRYSDSLAVIMMLEFDDWQKCNYATNVVGYSWARLGYHLWLSPEESKAFAGKFNITHPWKMKLFLIDENNKNDEVADFFNVLKTKLAAHDKNVRFDKLSKREVLNTALRLNPERIKSEQLTKEQLQRERAAYAKKHGKVDKLKLGMGCGNENCCQKNNLEKQGGE